MMYSGKNEPDHVFLAPKDFAGYVILINTGQEDQVNCKAYKVILEGALRIILLSTRTIKAGEQLLYAYGENYQFNLTEYNS